VRDVPPFASDPNDQRLDLLALRAVGLRPALPALSGPPGHPLRWLRRDRSGAAHRHGL